MRITRLQLESPAHTPLADASAVSPGLNVIPLGDKSRGRTLAELLHLVLYGHGADHHRRDRSVPNRPGGTLRINRRGRCDRAIPPTPSPSRNG